MRQTASGERLTITVLALLSAVLRAIAYVHYRFDSDEPQHLHVAWGWTAGLLQYRDLFDNHAPLFHILTAPILAWVGERPDVLLYMRAPMLLLFGVVLWATYVLGSRMYSRRVGIWSAVILSLFPTFFLKSLEYRTDNLWTTLWMVALVVLTGGPLTLLRLFVTGLVLGFALATSMKTLLLVLTLAATAAATIVFGSQERDYRRMIAGALAFIAGLAIPPAIIAAYFYVRGGWASLVYCVVKFSALLEQTQSPARIWIPRLAYLLAIYLLLSVARRCRAIAVTSRWRFFLAFASAFFLFTLYGFWLFISPRDLLPVMPLMMIFLVAAVERYATWPLIALAVLGGLFAGLSVHYASLFENQTDEEITMMNQVLHLTRPGELIVDLKGETIFRPRPFYFIFEHITRNAMRMGLIRDTIAEDVVRTQCHVAQADGVFFPPRGRLFLNENFLDMGRLRVAGQWIDADGSFTIAVPGHYVILTKNGEAEGILDSTPYRGQRLLESGAHKFVASGPAQHLACLWAPAFQRGYSPFHLKDREFSGSPVFSTAHDRLGAASRR